MRFIHPVLVLWLHLATVVSVPAGPITAAGQPAQLDIRAAGEHSIRVTLKPIGFAGDFPFTPAVTERSYPAPAVSLRDITAPATAKVGTLRVDVRPNPLTVVVTNAAGQPVQTLVFEPDGNLSFGLDGPVLGMGEGGPLPAPGSPWRSHAVQFDRRGQLDLMEPRWQADMYGSRNPAAMLLGTGGWGLFVATPWVQVDMRRDDHGLFIPYKPPSGGDAPQTRDNQRRNAGKGVHPVSAIVPGLYDVIVFDAHEPAEAMRDFAVITGPAAMPPRWALGYMQSHRELRDANLFRASRAALKALGPLEERLRPADRPGVPERVDERQHHRQASSSLWCFDLEDEGPGSARPRASGSS